MSNYWKALQNDGSRRKATYQYRSFRLKARVERRNRNAAEQLMELGEQLLQVPKVAHHRLIVGGNVLTSKKVHSVHGEIATGKKLYAILFPSSQKRVYVSIIIEPFFCVKPAPSLLVFHVAHLLSEEPTTTICPIRILPSRSYTTSLLKEAPKGHAKHCLSTTANRTFNQRFKQFITFGRFLVPPDLLKLQLGSKHNSSQYFRFLPKWVIALRYSG